MKKNLKKKALIPAIAMVLASVIALSGVTYAWFTTGNTATVQTLDVNVKTANGIQISLDAASWRSTINATDIKNAITNAVAYTDRVIQFPEGEIAPVSSAANAATDESGNYTGKMEMFYGEYNKDGTLKSEAVADKNGTQEVNYIAFDLFFKSSGEQDLTLKLGDNESYVKTSEAFGGADVGTETAVRVAFLNLGNAGTADAARALKGDGSKALVWEPNSSKRAPGGVEETGKLAYKGFKTGFEAVAEDALTADYVEDVETFDGDKVIVKLANGITKMRVYIWLEGQDVDCINPISFGDFAANLHFTVPEITEEG